MRIEARESNYCCGLDEVECSVLKSQFKNTKEGKIDLFESLLRRLGDEPDDEEDYCHAAALFITDINIYDGVTHPLHAALNEAANAIELGVNFRHEDNIVYMWLLKYDDIVAHIEKLKRPDPKPTVKVATKKATIKKKPLTPMKKYDGRYKGI